MARVVTGARLHFGFQNLSLAHGRLYGGVGAMLDQPCVDLTAEPAAEVRCDHDTVRAYAGRAVDLLGVEGATVTVESAPPRHVGLGSGTQLALATLAAVARAHDRPARARERAPDLGRGGRSGVGVAGFEAGGFVADAGHPTEQFTVERPADGAWTVPAVVARHDLPETWRFVVALPDAPAGPSDAAEDASMRAVVERADPSVADDLASLLVRRLLPAVAEGHLDAFGRAVAEFGRLNGAWYADEQGGVYRPPAGSLVGELADSPAVVAAGQSSWGPVAYGVTDADRVDDARTAARAALDAVGGGEVFVAAPRNEGARVED